MESILNWLNNNAMAIFISSFVSFFVSKRYYDKGNRENLLMTIIFPIVQILNNERYSENKYEKLCEIKSNYAIRYLHKKERKKLLVLMKDYKEVYDYDAISVKKDCIMSYYEHKLEENGINPESYPLTDDENVVMEHGYFPDYFHLENQIYDIIASDEFRMSPNEYAPKISYILNCYTKSHYSNINISMFDDYSITEIFKQSPVTQNWNDKFEKIKESRQEFLKLSICKEITKMLDYSKD